MNGPASKPSRGGAPVVAALARVAWLSMAAVTLPTTAHAIGDRPIPETRMPETMPAVPADGARLAPITGGTRTPSKAEIDPASLAVDDNAVIRLTLVVTSTGGARNVSYEAINCDRAERKILAFGRPDGSWSPARSAQWQPIRFDDSLHQAHADVYRGMCSFGRAAASKPDDLIRALNATKDFFNAR